MKKQTTKREDLHMDKKVADSINSWHANKNWAR